MDNITKKVCEEIERGWIGPNTKCPYHPSHFVGQDCTFCYCPFYPCNDDDLGQEIIGKRGKPIWECTGCLFMHRQKVAKYVMSEIKRLEITDPKDPRIKEVIFPATKEKFYKPGKALMVLGASSDAGKSLTAVGLCRALHNRGYLVAPFKSQNMSLNSKVTRKGAEIAMIQVLQARGAGLKNPDHHMNPILLKPKGDSISQVIVEGKPFGDYDVPGYYDDFVPNDGVEIVRRNVEYLKKRYDFVVMEGAGSPAEINIYNVDIANMKAAEMADAKCVLVVNVEWGGSFAYALGTVELLSPEDRSRIFGIILNNVRGDRNKMVKASKDFEKMTGLPVIGIIPHMDITLPTEDSESFRNMTSKGDGKYVIGVIKLPRIANFTDFDPLYLEDTTARFIDDVRDMDGLDAIIIPGTKNTLDDLAWLKSSGMADKIVSYKGKIPILGICGGYQMLGKSLIDPSGLEGSGKGTVPGLGLLDMDTHWSEYKKLVIQDRGKMILNDEPIEGYEIHMGDSETRDKPLFAIERFPDTIEEGSVREDDMVFGTYIHGIFDKPAFRKYFLSFVKHDGVPYPDKDMIDYDDYIEENIVKLSEGFEESVDVERIVKIMEEDQ